MGITSQKFFNGLFVILPLSFLCVTTLGNEGHTDLSLNMQDFEQNIQSWANLLEKEFNELQSITGDEMLRPIYRGSNFGRQEVNDEFAFAQLDKAVEKIEAIARQKEALVDKIKLAAEKAYKARSDSPPTGCYHRAKAVTLFPVILGSNETQNCSEKLYLPLRENPLFENKYVSMNYSVAHVPTNVYDLSRELVTVGNWTAGLDKVFRENAASDRTLKWQYFGSSTGFFKYYPGAMWGIQLDEMKLDFFDCRSQPWYLEASAYPKEMIILVDKSGSMKGRSDIISNATVAEILSTLTENDFFNVIMFSDVPKYADPTVEDRLIQASRVNKDRMIRKFKNFSPNGTASYERALQEAFSLLNKSQEQLTNGERCNRILMFITDSVPGSYKELLEQYNPEQNVRIFVHLLGQHSSAEPYVEELACSNRGYAVTISTLGDVKENVLKHLDVVARSNALLNDAYTVWTGVSVGQFSLKNLKKENFTNPYVATMPRRFQMSTEQNIVLIQERNMFIETLIASKEDEPTMYTSVAKAVYDRTRKAKRLKQGNLLGVAGIDVPLQSFRDALRSWKIGPNNYIFMVDNNGYILFHPAYRPVHKSILKSYYQNVDVNEVEIPEEVKIDPYTATPDYNTPLRQAMINRERKANVMNTHLITDNFHTTFRATMKYFSAPIAQTPFTLGLAVHWDPQIDMGFPIPAYAISERTRPENLNSQSMGVFAPVYTTESDNCSKLHNESVSGATLSPYHFCQFDEHVASLYLANPICALREVLLKRTLQKELECDSEYLDRVYLEAKETHDIFRHWNLKGSSPLIKKWGIQQAFAYHHTGLIRYHNYSLPVYPNFITDHMHGVEDPLYLETVLTAHYFSTDKLAVFHTPPNDLFRHYTGQQLLVPIPMTMPVYKAPQNDVVMAVVGLQFTHSQLKAIFDRLTNTCVTGTCQPCGSPNVHCYLINQAALVLVSSKGEKEVGQSLKEISCALVEAMVNQSVLTQYHLYDFQGICIEVKRDVISLATRLLAPFSQLYRLFVGLFYEMILFFLGVFEPIGQSWSTLSQGWDLYPESEAYHANRNNNPYGPYPPDSRAPDNNRFGQYGNNYVDRFNTFSSPYQVNNPQIEKRPPPSEVRPIPAGTLERAEFGLLTPTLPPLPGEPTDRIDRSRTEETDASLRIGSSAVTDSTAINTSLPTTTMEPELREEPIDEFFGKLDQDPFEAQRQAIMAIETCYTDQKVEIQRNRDAELYSNTSEEYESNETSAQTGKQGSVGRDTRYVPGSLLSCVHKAVQQRCHSGAGTSSFTGRYACEAVCEVVRERMAQLVHKLDDCKQPLSSCTERFVAFHVTPTWPPLPTQITSQSPPIGSFQTAPGAPSSASTRSSASIRGKKRDQSVQPYLAQGDYCHECGTRRWYLRPISGTNLFFLVDITLPGGSSGGCECRCMKRFRYGAQISTDPIKPRPIQPRRDAPLPERCSMIPAAQENSTVCTDDAPLGRRTSSGLIILGLVMLSARWS